MKVLDLFCGAGGASMGYHLAGHEVVGVDIDPQPNYPFEFIQGDAREAMMAIGGIDFIHASPPCQFATAYRRRKGVALDAVNLIPETREDLERTGLPYVIENVPTAGEWLRCPVQLCGSMFGLDVQRHRLFEFGGGAQHRTPPSCDHSVWTPRFPPATNRTNLRKTVEVGVWRIPLETQQRAMGIDWMPLKSLSQAIPPAYTKWIGEQL